MPTISSVPIAVPAAKWACLSRGILGGSPIGMHFPGCWKVGFLGMKSYFEFGAKDRPEGWNTWFAFEISDAPPTASAPPPPYLSELALRAPSAMATLEPALGIARCLLS